MLQGPLGQGYIAILCPLAIADADHHPLAVDIMAAKTPGFAEPQATAVHHNQTHLSGRSTHFLKQASCFLAAEHDRQLLAVPDADKIQYGPLP